MAWLSVAGVRPATLEVGGTLFVQGSGFPAGEHCTVRLAGRTSRPGLPSLRVSVSLPGRAIAGDEVAVRIDDVALSALGRQGSFGGELQLAFPVSGGGTVTGAGVVGFDLADPLGQGATQAQRMRERAARLLRFAGVEAATDAELDSGMTVAVVRAGSPAEALGLRAGDVITRSGGVRVHTLGDLAPPPYARAITWSVRDAGARSEQPRMLSLAGLDLPDPGAGLGRLSMLLAWLFACVLLLSPLPSPARWLARAHARLAHAPAAALGLWGGAVLARGRLRKRSTADWLRACVPWAASALGVLLVRFEPAGFLAVRSVSIYLGLCAASTMLGLTGRGALRARFGAALTTVGRMCVMGALIACACALSGTRALDGMVHVQGALPWEWGVATRPALLIAAPLYVLFASRLGGETLYALDDAAPARGKLASLLVAERVFTNVVLCALGAAMFAGGWQSPAQWLPPEIDARLVGAAAFVAKAWGFAWLLHAARRLELGRGVHRLTVLAVCLAVIALTALDVWLEPAPVLERALGRAVCACAALVLVSAWLEAMRDRTRARAGSPLSSTAPAGTADSRSR